MSINSKEMLIRGAYFYYEFTQIKNKRNTKTKSKIIIVTKAKTKTRILYGFIGSPKYSMYM